MIRSLCVTLVLAAPAPAQEPARPTPQAEIDAAIDAGVEFLLARQEVDGSWLYGQQQRPGCTALAVYTLLKSGLSPEHQAIQRALARLGLQRIDRTYDAACLILALTAHDPTGHHDWISELTHQLLDWQKGDWGYPSGADLSNTQYAALALRAAVLAGVDVSAETWFDLAKAVKAYGDGSGGYSYNGRGGGASGSMTCAGVGTMAICDAMLTRAGELGGEQGQSFARLREAGLEWLARNFSVETNPHGGSWLYYYLYGLERVGALCGVTRIGEHDWYAQGAAFLVEDQAKSGAWGGGRNVPQTCFALLFLRRATRAPRTGDHQRASRSFGTRDAQAAVQVAASGDTPLTLWITEWGPEAREREWPGEKGRGPHVIKVEYLAGPQIIGVVRGDRDVPVEAERFACRHSFRVPGRYRIRARAHLLGPTTTDPSGRVLPGAVRVFESPEFTVEIDDVVPAWMLEAARDPALNLLPRANPRAKASSICRGGDGLPTQFYEGRFALDNRLRTPWLADPEDAEPTLEIDLSNPQKADVIVLSNAMSTPYEPGFFSRALEVEVVINGTHRHRVRMHADERRKARLELERPILIRSLELKIRWKAPGKGHPAVGLAEVELQLSGADRR